MSVNVTGIYDLYKTDTGNVKKTSENATSVGASGIINVSGSIFDNEFNIKKAENTKDAYDRITENTLTEGLLGDGEKSDRALSADMIEQLGKVVNEDNFDMYEEFGLAPDKDDPTSILTVSERIEIELAATCENYKPVGNISMKDIEAMYGSTGRSYHIANELMQNGIEPDRENIQSVENALDKLEDIKSRGISSGAAEYLLVNDKQITIENTYAAVHSVASGNINKNGTVSENSAVNVYEKISDTDWESLSGQAKDIIENSGLEVNNDTLNDARWLVENKIPMTAENLYKLSQIRDINDNQLADENAITESGWISKLSSDMTFLGSASDSSMDFYSTIKGDSIEAVTILNEGTEEQVTSLVMDGKDVTLLNLKRVQEKRSQEASSQRQQLREEKADELENRKKVVAAKRTLEEARLRLTVGSGAFLIKNGFNINISTLSDTVDKLRKIENNIAAEVFESVGYKASGAELELYSSTTVYMRQFASTPSYVLGRVYSSSIEFTITAMTEEGRSESFTRALANVAYDTLGTKPDRTLGDSLAKAFHNISGMLEGMGYENTVMNSRAVRILAYNELEINRESVERIKDMDTEVSRLIDNLTPKTTAYLIANGINPLNTNISELNSTLERINSQIQIEKDEVEKYSEYLWKLDKNKSISAEDRDIYIGIYRVLNMIEKSDRKAIGAIAKQGGELTMRNLLTATRSLRDSGMDISIDDAHGLTGDYSIAENNIDHQLRLLSSSSFYKRAKESVSPELVESVIKEEEADVKDSNHRSNDRNALDEPIEDFVKNMSEASFATGETEDYGNSYNSVIVNELENLRYVSEDIMRNLMEDKAASNINNILGAGYLLNSGRRLYDRIVSVSDDESVQASVDAMEHAESVEELEDSINELNERVRQAMLGKSAINAEDVMRINGVVGYIKHAAEKQSYYVPMEYGEEKTLIKLTLNSAKEAEGRLDIRVYAEEEIEVAIQTAIENNDIRINVLETTGIDRENADHIARDIENRFRVSDHYGDLEQISNNTLLNIAKEFISIASQLR